MSKATRIKGPFNPIMGFRTSPVGRVGSLRQRSEGITARHTPTPKTRAFKLTKTQRKELKAMAVKGNDPMHPSPRKDTRINTGTAYIMGLVSSIIHTPEQQL